MWERIKLAERAQKAKKSSGELTATALAGIPAALPALTRALKLQAKAGKVGFDWNDPLAVLAKIREEADEIERELAAANRATAAADVDPEAMLRVTNRKFERRFAMIERALADRGKTPQAATLEEMDELWNEAKAAEGGSRSNASR
jgi:ATP diphosphatase